MSEPAVYMAYPDIPGLVDPNDVMIDFILGITDREAIPERNVNSELPATGLVGRLPFVYVNHWDGDVGRFEQRPIVDVSVFASTYRTARNTARAIEDRLLGYPLRVSSGGRSVLVDMVEAPDPTREVEWQQDSTIRRFQGTYQFSIRR